MNVLCRILGGIGGRRACSCAASLVHGAGEKRKAALESLIGNLEAPTAAIVCVELDMKLVDVACKVAWECC